MHQKVFNIVLFIHSVNLNAAVLRIDNSRRPGEKILRTASLLLKKIAQKMPSKY